MIKSVYFLIVACAALVSYLQPRLLAAVKRRPLLAKIPFYRDGHSTWHEVKKQLSRDPVGFLARGLKRHPEGFQIDGDQGPLIIIPPKYGPAINSNAQCSSLEPLQNFLRFDLSGGEGLFEIHNANHDLFVTMLRKYLSQHSGELHQTLAQEALTAFDSAWGVDEEWNEISLRPTIIYAVSRISTRIFLGQEMCTNEDWLNIVSEYVIKLFDSSRALRFMPGPLARIYHTVSEQGRALRAQVRQARNVLQPFIDATLETVESSKHGLAERPYSAIAWLHDTAKGKKYDAVAMQLGISAVAIHTTTDLLSQTILDLATHPEILAQLRQEIADASNGDPDWLSASSALQNLKLMDSVIKETQRVKPVGGATTLRYVRSNVTLPNGMIIPQGSTVLTAMSRMWDPDFYSSPQDWNGYRFVQRRTNSETARAAQLVATSSEHLGFGQGLHACPGRFFAAAETKIALTYILQNYDFEPVGGKEIAKPMVCGLGEFYSNPMAKLRVRRREIR